MPITHIPEVAAENPYQKTGTINRQENRACPICYENLIGPTRKIWYQIVCQTHQKPVPVFWYQFLAMISGKCVMDNIKVNGPQTHRLPHNYHALPAGLVQSASLCSVPAGLVQSASLCSVITVQTCVSRSLVRSRRRLTILAEY